MRLFEHLIAFGGELCFDFGTIEPTARRDRLARPGYLLAEKRLIVPRLPLPLDVLPYHFTQYLRSGAVRRCRSRWRCQTGQRWLIPR